jgi:hypothetical protein
LSHRDRYRDKNIRGGPPGARSPLSAATEQGADREDGAFEGAKRTKDKPFGEPFKRIAVFVGGEIIGTITESRYCALAWSGDAFMLGIFAERYAAADAIGPYHRNNGRAA